MAISQPDACDSFKAYGSLADALTYWTSITAGSIVHTDGGAFGSPCIECPNSSLMEIAILTSSAERMVSGWMKIVDDVGRSGTMALCEFRGGSPIYIQLLSNGQIRAIREGWSGGADVVIWSTAAGTWTFGVNHHVEVYYRVGGIGAAIIKLKLDGSDVTLTSGSTAFNGTTSLGVANPTRLLFRLPRGKISHFWTAPCTGESFVGTKRVEYLAPRAAGAVTGWTPNGAATNWEAVGEAPLNATSYNESTTVSQEDSFLYDETFDDASGIVAVVRASRAINVGGSGRSILQSVRSGGSPEYASGITPTGTAKYFKKGFLVDPDGDVEWTKEAVDAIEGGYILAS